ncbi:hypothetical protein GHT06_022617 [Daphnia sinensis]|uniref:RNase H type-1 domain-containing protein n=1 Tax=Daphnia sinensis TaxID=1820382 RepID=A0AAD5PR90_9CRUS|nr:hypothetical protein GHT06_022617 [Daphnia sinensis]
MFADDISARVTHTHRRKARQKLETALKKILKWCKTWRFTLSVSKCFTISFSRRTRNDVPLQLTVNDEIIPNVNHGKFLGIIFDRKLKWKPHLMELLRKVSGRVNLFKILVRRNVNLKPKLLINLYIALIRSVMDYSYLSIIQCRAMIAKKLDVIQNSIIRAILLSPNSTPRAHSWLDTGLVPISCRCEWLACQYLIRLQFKPKNPMFYDANHTYLSTAQWKFQSTPNIVFCKFKLLASNLHLFNESPFVEDLLKPPWIMPKIPTTLFPLSKNTAASNQTFARILFRAFFNHCNIVCSSSINVFTDGSHDPTDNSTACAIYCPNNQLKKAWKLDDGTSIFTAELMAIKKATELTDNESAAEIRIFSDSLSAIQAINSPRTTNKLTISIRNKALHALAAGTKITLCWIPSHIGIPENDIVDRLANDARVDSQCEKIIFTSSVKHVSKTFHEAWSIVTRAYLESHHIFFSSYPRRSLTPDPWLIHPCRQKNTILHKIRTNRLRLNDRVSKFDYTVSPLCPRGCPFPETPLHVLIECPHYAPHRQTLTKYLAEQNLQLNIPTLLNPPQDCESKVKYKIRDLLLSFIWNSGLFKRF